MLSNIPSVSIDRLHTALGAPEPIALPEASLNRPLAQWRGEVEDAAILAQVYQALSPRRHLEFGTWQGQGALLCLRHSSATVWTLNLLEGETSEAGDWRYARELDPALDIRGANVVHFEKSWVQTDARQQIGHQIHAAGLGHRVCQIYADSRDWDTAAYPKGFFDTVLIDGGHQPEVVASDTRKALPLVRPGGLVMWHDFCLDQAAAAAHAPVAGVQAGVAEAWAQIDAACRRVFWVNPSLLLMGVVA